MIETWALIWKYTFLTGITLFAAMSIWVIIAGGMDIIKMLQTLKNSKEHSD